MSRRVAFGFGEGPSFGAGGHGQPGWRFRDGDDRRAGLVQRAVDGLVESGAEHAVQVAVYRRGELVVDAVGGVADPADGRKAAGGTPFFNFSIGKGATATVAHVLAEHGVFGYDTRVVDLWPEFGAHGKDSVTIRHVLTHPAGVPAVPQTTTVEDLCDWEQMCDPR